jgi:hypothetical protein
MDAGEQLAAEILDAIRSGRDLWVFDQVIEGSDRFERARNVLIEKRDAPNASAIPGRFFESMQMNRSGRFIASKRDEDANEVFYPDDSRPGAGLPSRLISTPWPLRLWTKMRSLDPASSLTSCVTASQPYVP